MWCANESLARKLIRISVLGVGLTLLAPPTASFADDSCTPAHSNGTDVTISDTDNILPASDLVCDSSCLAVLKKSGSAYNLSPQEALADKLQDGLDLSTLEPSTTTDVFPGTSTLSDDAADQALPVQNWDEVGYVSDICSPSGYYRFNIQTQGSGSQPSETLTVMLARDLHTYLLRQELLRALGYRVPAIKYLPHIKLRIPQTMVQTGTDKSGKPTYSRLIDRILEDWLPVAAGGSAIRWCGMAKSALAPLLAQDKTYPCSAVPDSDTNADPYTIELQDVVVMDATPTYYDLALGPPISTLPGTTQIEPETMRIIRALSVVYGFLNVPESVNQLDWFAARSDSGSVTLHVPDLTANFATTMDDALWITRRLAQLSRQDFQQIVAHAQFPQAVADDVLEKLIARRDNLVSTLGVKVPSLPFDTNVSDPPALLKGKLIQTQWPGYASAFATGDPPSPLKGIQWYILSEAQSNAMESLMTMANNAIPQLSAQAAATAHGEQLVQNAMTQYLTTGASTGVNFGAWVAPTASGSVQISRDVVFGAFMGTNNIVQLADTFGFTGNVGLIVGFDALPAGISLSAAAQASLSISLTHLKPLTQMKDIYKQPLQNEVVAWVFKDAASVFQQINDSKTVNPNLSDPTVVQNLNDALAADVNKLSKYIDVGESLILTESVTGNEEIAAGFGPVLAAHHNLLPTLGPSVDETQIILSRVHFLRKDQNTLTIFKDNGDLVGPTFTMEFTLGSEVQFPVFSLTGQKVSGKATDKVFQISLNPNVQANPSIYDVAGGVASLLRTGSTEVLESQLKMKPKVVSVAYKDSSSSLQFLHWVRRTLKTDGDITVTLEDGTTGHYLYLTDGKQTGASYQSLATQIGSYLVQRLTGNNQLSIDTQVNPNPGQSFFGHSQTRDASYQAQLNPASTGSPATVSNSYVGIQYRWEGWDMSAADMQKLVAGFASTYGVQFYDPGFLQTSTDVKMYEVQLVVNVYDAAIKQIMSMSQADEKIFNRKYWALHGCDNYQDDIQEMSSDDITACAMLEKFTSSLDSYRKGEKGNEDKLAQDALEGVSALEQLLSFKDFVAMAGGPGAVNQPARVYVTSRISGIFEGNEDNTDPISATHTFGLPDAYAPSGIVNWIENDVFGIDDGEFNMKWLREVL